MKTITFLTLMLLISVKGFAQNKPVDDIFNKFENKEGVTSVHITKNLMGLAAQIDSSDLKCRKLFSQIDFVRILVFEHANANDKSTFNSLVKSLPLTDYKELMVVKKNDQLIQILMNENQGKVSDFLLLVTGEKEPAMINIRGNINPKDLGKLSSEMHVNGMGYLACLNKGKK
jgi:hypothetical protein